MRMHIATPPGGAKGLKQIAVEIRKKHFEATPCYAILATCLMQVSARYCVFIIVEHTIVCSVAPFERSGMGPIERSRARFLSLLKCPRPWAKSWLRA